MSVRKIIPIAQLGRFAPTNVNGQNYRGIAAVLQFTCFIYRITHAYMYTLASSPGLPTMSPLHMQGRPWEQGYIHSTKIYEEYQSEPLHKHC